MKLEPLIYEFSMRRTNIEFFAPDSQGRHSALVENTHLIHFETSNSKAGFFLYAGIIKVPKDQEHRIFKSALEGNLFHKETGDASIGYHEESQWLILQKFFEETNFVYSLFEENFDSFLKYLIHWKKKTGEE